MGYLFLGIIIGYLFVTYGQPLLDIELEVQKNRRGLKINKMNNKASASNCNLLRVYPELDEQYESEKKPMGFQPPCNDDIDNFEYEENEYLEEDEHEELVKEEVNNQLP